MASGAFHESYEQHEAVAGSSDRNFGLTFAAVFLFIGLAPLVAGDAFRPWAIVLAAVFLIAALARPQTLAPLNRLWREFGLLLHRLINPAVMSVLFFVAVTPTALAMRLFGKDPLRLKFERAAESYWIDRVPPGPDPETMRNQF